MESNIARSVVKATKILGLFKQKDEWGITEIARELSYPGSSVHRLMMSLEEAGYVYKNSVTNKYALGIELFLLGNRVKIVDLLEERAAAYINELAERLNESVHISIVQNDKAMVVLSATSKWQVSVLPDVGQSRRIYVPAVGRCLLAYNSGRCYDQFSQKGEDLIAYNENTITDREEIDRILQEIRKNGYAIDYEEVEKGLICVGAPLFSGKDFCVAAMSCSVPKNRFEGREEIIRDAVLETARQISNALSR